MKYNTNIVIAFFRECGVPKPELEFRFHPERKFRFDFAWPRSINPIALEVEGGIWTGGAHGRGVGIIRDMEKYNLAASLGWRVIRCVPKDLCTTDTAAMIKTCLGI